MAPMTRCRSIKDNVPNALMATYYTQRASAGLIITEGSQISSQGVGYPYTPGIYTDAQVKGWRLVTKAVHDKEGKIFLQLWHVGRVSHSSYHNGELPVAPSAIKLPGQIYTYEGMQDFQTPRALSIQEIQDIIEDYVKAAQNAIDAGFDGVEIHGANGYLLDQFLRDGTNKRKDKYGSNIENRSRLLTEVIEAVSDKIGSDKVGVRLSPSGTFNGMSDSNPQEHFGYVAKRLNDFNLAYLHIVDALEGDIRHGADVVDLSIIRKAYKGLLIVCGGYTKERGDKTLQNHQADAIAYGNLFISNPDLPKRFKVGAKLNEADSSTFYTQDATGYTDYSCYK